MIEWTDGTNRNNGNFNNGLGDSMSDEDADIQEFKALYRELAAHKPPWVAVWLRLVRVFVVGRVEHEA